MQAEWHKLVEENTNWVKWIINTDFPYIAKRGQEDFEDAVCVGNLALVKAARKYIEVGDGRPFINYCSKAIHNAIYRYYRYNDKFTKQLNNMEMKEHRHEFSRGRQEFELKFIPEYIHRGFEIKEAKEECNILLNKTNLSQEAKRIMRLYYWEDMTYNEIAAKMELQVDYVKCQLELIRRRLRKAACVVR
jgi:RNA polymerase sigma factor (sigma-70 family)